MTALEAMRTVAAALDAAGAAYMVVGSLSVSAYGVPRGTHDADFVVELGASSVHDVLKALGPGFLLDPQMSFESITCTTRYRLTDLNSGFMIELFLLSEDPHDRARFARRRKATYAGADVYIATPEDVVITKLRWSQRGRRVKDVEDVKNLLRMRGDRMDWEYIHRWADAHATRDLLDELRASLNPQPGQSAGND